MSRPLLQRLMVPATVGAVLATLAVGALWSKPGTQLRVVRAIRDAGGTVNVIAPRRAGWLGRVRAALPDAFGEVRLLHLADIPMRRRWLAEVREWKKLDNVWLNRTGVKDTDLECLAGGRTYFEVYLSGNPITSAGILKLGPQGYLGRLELNWTRVDRLQTWTKLVPNLQILKLRGTPVSDADLAAIATLRHLHGLDLSRTRVTDKGLELLHGLKTLYEIDLRGTPTTYEAAVRLQAKVPWRIVYARDGTLISPERSPARK